MNKDMLEKETLRKEMAEGYKARREENAEINEEWEEATLEGWG